MNKDWIEKCPECKHPFSDWFVWSDALRFCFLCWEKSGFKKILKEDGSSYIDE